MSPTRLLTPLVLAVTFAVAAPYQATAAPAAPPAPTRRVAPHTSPPYRPTGRLQVKFKDGVSVDRQAVAYARATARGYGVSVAKRIPGLNAALLAVTNARAVQAILLRDSAVEFVEPETRYEAFVEEPATNEIVEIQADQVHTASNFGAGKEIAVIDSIVDATNADLNGVGKVVVDWNSSTPVTGDPTFTDLGACTAAACPHGTAVAVVAAGERSDGNVAGVAPEAKIRSYNVFRQFSYASGPDTLYTVSASSADIAAALTYIKDHIGTTPNLVAVNMSLGGRFDNALIRRAIAELHAAAPQLVIIAAAGNDGGERANFPAGDPYVLSVGATGQTPLDVDCPSTPPATTVPWTVTGFSNRGDVDVVAPGRCITSWWPPENDAGQVTGPAVLAKVDGTSFAAPMVAGEVALLAASASPVTGDRARAAVVAGADHDLRSVDAGVGPARALDSIAVAAGPSAYTALDVVRGAQVATIVGRRQVEAIRVDPSNPTAPVGAPELAVSAGFGTVTPTATYIGFGLTTVEADYVAPATDLNGKAFNLAANTSLPLGDPDHPVVPMRMLDSGDNFEGLPVANADNTVVALKYGSRTGYIRSASLKTGTLGWTFTYNADSFLDTDIFVWVPSRNGGTADAADAPVECGCKAEVGPNTDSTTVGAASDCGSPCPYGRYLVGWLLASSHDDSDPADPSSLYRMTLSYAGPTATLSVPVYTSDVSTTGPFTVSWGGTLVAKWDVSWAYKVQTSTGFHMTAWQPWKVGTTSTSATFGASGSPTTVKQGVTYWFLVKAWDSLGNPSLTMSKYTSAPFDDRYSGLSYSTGWTSIAHAARWLGTYRKAGSAGRTASMSSYTSRFTVIGDRCAACGQVKVYIDGVYKATFDTKASTTLVRQVLYTSPTYSGIHLHSIKLVVVGTAGRPYVMLDGIAIYR